MMTVTTRSDLPPDGWPVGTSKSRGQPRRVVAWHPDGDHFALSRFAGWCGDGCGQRLNMGTFVVKRGKFLYLPGCDPAPPETRCVNCAAPVTPHLTPELCDDCWVVAYGLSWNWWRRAKTDEIPAGFTKGRA